MNKGAEFRASSLNERKEFYEKEFNVNKIKNWFKSNGMRIPQLCAVDAGTETGIIADKKLKNELLYFPFRNLIKKIKRYVPEDVYYCRNIYENPDKILRTMKFGNWKKQEIVFDIDADNIKCKCTKGKVCDKCINIALTWTKKMSKRLKKYFNKIKIVYSGRGFHIHIFDKSAFSLSFKKREEVVRKFSNFPIDPWVSMGYIDLIRMPYSLNGLVSRKVIPINEKFDRKSAIPRFLRY